MFYIFLHAYLHPRKSAHTCTLTDLTNTHLYLCKRAHACTLADLTHTHTHKCAHTCIFHRHTPAPVQACTYTHLQISQAHICTRANMHTQYTYRPHRHTHTHTKLSITTFSGLVPWLSDPKAFPVLFSGPDFSSQHSGGEGCNCPGLQLRGFW